MAGTSTGTTASSSTGSSTGSSSTSGAKGPTIVQSTTWTQTFSGTGTPPLIGNTLLQFNQATTKGNTIWLAFTVSDYGGIHTITITDTQSNTFTLLDQENDAQPGAQTVAQFYAANIPGDTGTPDTITVSAQVDNYKGLLLTELGGVTSSPVVGHSGNIQDGISGAGTNNVTSGTITVPSGDTPALLLAVSMNTNGGCSDTGGTGSGGPTVGTGLTQEAAIWNFCGGSIATWGSAAVDSTGDVAALFNSTDGTYVTVATVFR